MTRSLSILIIDDDEDIREALRDILERAGYQIATAAHGADAMSQLRAGERPGVIVLDLMMPVMDGYEFVAEKRKDPELAGIPIVVITAGGYAAEKAAALGAAGYVQKPFKANALLYAIRQATG